MGMSSGSSNNQSSSTGSAYNYNQSLAQSAQDVWGAQVAPLTNMYNQATGLANSQAGQVGPAAQRLAGQVMPGANFGLSQMMQFANPNSALAQQQTANLANTIGDQFNRTILPGIRTGAGIGGNIGGSREALAKGVAAGDAARAISEGGTNFYANAYNQAAQAASQLPAMAGQIYNLGMSPFSAQWAPLQSLAGILGGPTALSRSQAYSQGEGMQASQSQSSGSMRQFQANLW